MIKNCRKVAKEAKDKQKYQIPEKKSDEKDRKVPAFNPFFLKNQLIHLT